MAYINEERIEELWTRAKEVFLNKKDAYTHPNSKIIPGTYTKITVDEQGHVMEGSNPRTLEDYGITDAAKKTELEDVRKSFQDGCSKIAAAITSNGVSTAATASPDMMASNISNIRKPDNGGVTASLNCGQSYTIPKGYHNGSGRVTSNSLASQTPANATALQILKGMTAWVNGNKITGSIASKAAATYIPKVNTQTIAAGQYLSGVQTIKGDANLVGANIVSGKSIFGVSGTAKIETEHIYSKRCDISAGTWSGAALSANGYVNLTSSSINSSWQFNHNLNLNLEKVTFVAMCMTPHNGFRIGRGYAASSTTAQYHYITSISLYANNLSDNYISGGILNSNGFILCKSEYDYYVPTSSYNNIAEVSLRLYPNSIGIYFDSSRGCFAIKGSSATFSFTIGYTN